jgi:cytochrome oxidase Cu insertion factor (SCO1/SenC/PrrC family)
MTRLLFLALGIAALALASVVAPAAPAAQAKGLDDLMMDLNIAPLDAQAPPAFSVTTLEGRRVALADVKGKAALVYFWATW